MPRITKGASRNQKRKRLLRQAKGYHGQNSTHRWKAKIAVRTAGLYAYRDRRNRKRDYRALWITRLTAACRMRGTRYSVFVNGCKLAGVLLNRKMLSEIAVQDPTTFDQICKTAVDAATKAAATKA
ncbi:MAG: 50S ribosomal protein L20 [bacterium]